MPGAVAPHGTGSTHYNGMPGGTINPTIDGVNNSSNGFKSGGTSFFGTVPARLGAIEEVTVESAGLGGDAGVTGGVNLKFVTRRGTNQYRGSVFEQYRTEKLNANSFNNERAACRRTNCAGTTSAATSAARSCRRRAARQAVLLRQLRAGVHPADDHAHADAADHRGAAGHLPLPDRGRRAAHGERAATSPAQNGFSVARAIRVIADPPRASRQRRAPYGTVTSTNNLRTESSAGSSRRSRSTTTRPSRVDYQIKPNLNLMSSYNRYNQDAQGRRIWPFPDYPIQADTFDSGWWVWSNG